MAELNPPYVLDGEEHPGPVLRATMSSLLANPRGGIVHPDHLAVTASGSPDMNVHVAPGTIWVPGSLIPEEQFLYGCTNDAEKTLAVPPADSTNARWDLIVARVYDANFAGSDVEWAIELVAGTPAGSPAFPATPANSRILADLVVPANDTTISSGQITDRRISDALGTAGAHGTIICTSTTRPTTGLYAGLSIYETDTKRHLEWQGVSLGWTPPWSTSWGVVGAATKTASQAAITSAVDISSLSVTFDAVTGRRYRGILTIATVDQASAGGFLGLFITTSGNTVMGATSQTVASGVQYGNLGVTVVETGLSGSTTRKARASVSAGSATVTASSTLVSRLVYEDVGPS